MIDEIKNCLEGINSQKIETEERVSDLKDKTVEILPQSRIKKKE